MMMHTLKARLKFSPGEDVLLRGFSEHYGGRIQCMLITESQSHPKPLAASSFIDIRNRAVCSTWKYSSKN
jgi:hypothetical protein